MQGCHRHHCAHGQKRPDAAAGQQDAHGARIGVQRGAGHLCFDHARRIPLGLRRGGCQEPCKGGARGPWGLAGPLAGPLPTPTFESHLLFSFLSHQLQRKAGAVLWGPKEREVLKMSGIFTLQSVSHVCLCGEIDRVCGRWCLRIQGCGGEDVGDLHAAGRR
jgi:hypothetical protein